MKLSIIIPVYNVEQYVEKCLTSCLTQNVPSDDYEIIVINDGTKDNSLSVIERVAKEHSNIRIFSQENQGLSMARNNGLDKARGDYVWFVDSDDWIEQNCLAEIIQKIYENDLDALTVVAANVYGDNIKRRMEWGMIKEKIFTGRDFAMKIGYIVCVPFTIYRRNFLLENKLSFMPNVFHEDSEFTPRAYYRIKKIGVYNDITYFVRQNPNSITRSVNPKKSFDLLKVARSLYDFAKSTDKRYAKHVKRGIITDINSALLGAKDFSFKELQLFREELINNRDLFKCYFSNFNLKFYLEGLFFYFSPQNSVSIYNFFNLIFFHRRKR